MTRDPRWSLSGGVEVRPLTLDDADDLFALVDADRGRLGEWFPWVQPLRSVEDERAWLRSLPKDGYEGLGIFVEGRVAGGTGLSTDPFGVTGEIGYWIAPEFEGRGIVTETCHALIDFGFGRLKLHRIVIRAGADNARSRAIPERLGFTQEGVLREEGKGAGGFHDLVVYGLLEDEWLPRS